MRFIPSNASDRITAAHPGASNAAATRRSWRPRIPLARDLLFGSIALIPVSLLALLLLLGRTPSTSAENLEAITPVKALVTSLPPADANLLLFWLEVNQPTLDNIQAQRNAAERNVSSTQHGPPANHDPWQATATEAQMAQSRLRHALETTVGAVSAQMSAAGRREALRWLREQDQAGARAP